MRHTCNRAFLGRYRGGAMGLLLSVALLLLAADGLLAQELVAVIEEAEGTVEIQVEGGAWEPAGVGDIVPIAARISTGFGARAVLAVGENAVVTVQALTRLGIDQLVREEGVERSELNLEVGRIDGVVERADVGETEFELRSAIATASVRGTRFRFNGRELTVEFGNVHFGRAILAGVPGQEINVTGGEESSTDGVTRQVQPSEARARRGEVTHVTESGADDGRREETRRETVDPAIVTITFEHR